MDDNKIREMSEVEGMLTRYVQRYVNPEVASRYRYVSEQHAREHPKSSAPIIGSVYGSAGMQSRDMSQWKPADTAGILDYVADKVGKDKAMSLDMVNLVEAWKAAYIKNYGKERYEEISKNVEFGDLATYYVNTRMRHLMLERLAQEKVPKSSLEYIAVSAAQSSLVGTVLTSLTDREKQKEFEMVRRLYNPSAGEKVAAEASAFALDCLSLGPLGGMGSGAGFTGRLAAKANYQIVSSRLANRFGTEFAEKMLARGVRTEQWLLKNTAKTEFIGFELFDRGGEIIRDSGGDSKELSRLLYGDEGTCDKIRSAREGKALDSDICEAVNACLNRKVITEFRDGNASRYSKVIADRAGGDGAAMLDGVREIINYNGLAHLPNKKVPDWMIRKCSEDVCIKNAGYYLGIALEMQSKGKTAIKVGSREMTLQQVTQQAYDYARAADRKSQDRPRTPKDALEERISENEAYLNAVGLIPDDRMTDAEDRQRKETVPDSHILQQVTSALHRHGMAYLPESRWPQWMDRMDEETLATNARRFRNIAIQMQSARRDTVSVNGQQMTLQEVSQRAYDYARASDAKYKEAQAKSRLEEEEERRWNENMAAIEEGNRMPEPKATEAKDDTKTRYAVQITTGDQQGQSQSGDVQQRGRMTRENSAPWKGWLDTLGLGGLSDLTENLGYTIAMMPEMLAGMFTGKIRGFSMKDNMMPLALIFGGLLFGKRNPLLRLLMLGFGGMMLLNNANKVLTGKGEGQPQQARTVYRRIEDEPLNPRIRNVELKGNTILAEVDGLHTIFTIESERTIDAYNKGVLPLNVMCNAALRKFDESMITASENYESIARRQEEDMQVQEQQRIK